MLSDLGAETLKTRKDIVDRLKKEDRYDKSLDPAIDALSTLHFELKSVRTQRKKGFDIELIKIERALAASILQYTRGLSLVDKSSGASKEVTSDDDFGYLPD